jgi:uncharacterized protein (DUF433 family)
MPVASEAEIDWSEFPLAEIRLGVLSGAAVLRGTRMPLQAIIDNADHGVSLAEIVEQFEIPADCVQAVVSYARSHRPAHCIR